MEKKNIIINDLWNGKALILFHLINRSDSNNVLSNGFSKTERYPFSLCQSDFDKLFQYVNADTSVALIAIPDELYMSVFNMDESSYYTWKEQFDYVNDDYGNLQSGDIGSFCMWQPDGDYIENFIPSYLVFATISLNEKGEVVYSKNDKYYDCLNESQRKELSELLRQAYYEYDMPYDKYTSLVRRIR